jgi:hypothetical protein
VERPSFFPSIELRPPSGASLHSEVATIFTLVRFHLSAKPSATHRSQRFLGWNPNWKAVEDTGASLAVRSIPVQASWGYYPPQPATEPIGWLTGASCDDAQSCRGSIT